MSVDQMVFAFKRKKTLMFVCEERSHFQTPSASLWNILHAISHRAFDRKRLATERRRAGSERRSGRKNGGGGGVWYTGWKNTGSRCVTRWDEEGVKVCGLSHDSGPSGSVWVCMIENVVTTGQCIAELQDFFNDILYQTLITGGMWEISWPMLQPSNNHSV